MRVASQRAVVTLIGAVVLLASPAALADVRIDGVAAVIGERGESPDVVLRSDVELRARIELSGQVGAPFVGPLSPAVLQASLQEMIGEHLIAREARRVQAARPGPAELAGERRRLTTTAGGQQTLDALLQALGANPAELTAVVERRALVAAFLKANLEGATVVTDAEVAREYDAHADRFADVDRAQALARIRNELARDVLHRTIQRWVTVLRARTAVRVYAAYTSGV